MSKVIFMHNELDAIVQRREYKLSASRPQQTLRSGAVHLSGKYGRD